MTVFSGRFAGKRAVVSGAASGIGRACAMRLADEGAEVALLDRSPVALQATADEIVRGGGVARTYHADCSIEDEIGAAMDSAATTMGRIDILIACAGIEVADREARLDQISLEAWNMLITTNLTGQFLTCKHALRHMVAGRGGAIVCLGSNTGSLGMAVGEPAYSASKGGIFAMMKVAAIDFARLGVRVNMVIPGFIDTPMNDQVMNDPPQLEYWSEQVPLGRAGRADEVAAAALWLASDEASYCIGTALVVDGGQSSI